MSMLKLPKFKNESEEAQWWYDHREDLDAEFERAAANGTLGEGTLGRALKRQKAREEREQAPELSGSHAK
jgi:hypothetical protein